VANDASSSQKGAVFRARLLSTVILWALVTGVFLSGHPWAYVGLVWVLAIAGTFELAFLFQAVPGRKCRWVGVLVGILMVLILGRGFASGAWSRPDFTIEMGGLVAVTLLSFTVRFRSGIEGQDSVMAVCGSLFSYVYVPVLFGSFVMRLMFLPVSEGVLPGAWLLLMMIASAKFTDMGAYLTGSLIGKNKMAPRISPGKTWEGCAGAMVFAQIAGWGVWAMGGEHLSWIPAGHVAVISLLMGIAAVAGDLAESILKRSLEVKDSGSWMPGIGGILDLIDSLCFAAPVLYFYLLVMKLI